MLQQVRRLPNLQGVAANATATLAIPRGPAYLGIVLEFVNNAVAATLANFQTLVTRVVVRANGRAIFDITGADLVVLNQYYKLNPVSVGGVFQAGQLFIPFSREMRFPVAEDNLALGTQNLDSLVLEVTLGAATTPVLNAYAVQALRNQELGAIVEVQRRSESIAGAGTFELQAMPRATGNLFALHCQSSAITQLELSLNGNLFIDVPLAVLHNEYARKANRSPVTNVAHLDPTWRNQLEHTLPFPNIEDIRLRATVTGATTITTIIETLNAPMGVRVVQAA